VEIVEAVITVIIATPSVAVCQDTSIVAPLKVVIGFADTLLQESASGQIAGSGRFLMVQESVDFSYNTPLPSPLQP